MQDIYNLIEKICNLNDDKTCIIDDTGNYTYADFLNASLKVCKEINKKGGNKMFKNNKFRLIEDRNWRKEIKLNKKQNRVADEYINQYF